MKIQTEAFRKIDIAEAAEICGRADLSEEAKRYLVPGLTPQGFLASLMQGRQHADAVRFMAFALPIREGVWWACMVAHALAATKLSEPHAICLERAAAWVHDPSDAVRRSCLAAAEAADLKGTAAFAALGAFWSGGSMAPPDVPEALPDPRLGPIAVGASVLLAITGADPKQVDHNFEDAIRRALDIADGGNGRG